MISTILSHTPIYVWAILAFLVARGVSAMRDRELSLKTLAIIPLVMLGLSLQDIASKFGLGGLPLAAWVLGAGLAVALVWRFGSAPVSAGSSPGLLKVRGSRLPLALMLAIFCTKYATAVSLAIHPELVHTLFAALVCALFGVFNGLFLGRLLAAAAFVHGQGPAGLNGQGASA